VKPTQQLVFSEIVFPNDPGISDWIVVGGIVIAAIIFVYSGWYFYKNNKHQLKAYLRLRWILLRSRSNPDACRKRVDEIYRLLLTHFGSTLLPEASQLPPSLQEQVEPWTLFKDKLNAVRFSDKQFSQEEILQLLAQCRLWIR